MSRPISVHKNFLSYNHFIMSKMESLKELELRMIADKTLPLRESNLVFGEGNPDASVVFIGEAPGQNEDRLKRPFVGRGGQLLERLIIEIGWRRDQVYITNIVKRRPPDNRDPSPEEIEAYKPYLTKQVEIINPKIIVPLGRFAMNYFLPEAKITRDQGKVFRVQEWLVVPILHPAAALRGNDAMDQFKTTMRKLPDIVSGKYMPETFKIIESRPRAKKTESSQARLL
jgi:uracil-DNA glycosylase